MVSDPVTPSVEQCYIIIFLLKETVKQAEILPKLNAQYGEEAISCASACNWCSEFFEGCEEVLNLPHTHIGPEAVHVNVSGNKELILGKRQITMRDISSNSGISVGNVETIIH
jgi:hypothetical protein